MARPLKPGWLCCGLAVCAVEASAGATLAAHERGGRPLPAQRLSAPEVPWSCGTGGG